jgi:hypothetical protein
MGAATATVALEKAIVFQWLWAAGSSSILATPTIFSIDF